MASNQMTICNAQDTFRRTNQRKEPTAQISITEGGPQSKQHLDLFVVGLLSMAPVAGCDCFLAPSSYSFHASLVN